MKGNEVDWKLIKRVKPKLFQKNGWGRVVTLQLHQLLFLLRIVAKNLTHVTYESLLYLLLHSSLSSQSLSLSLSLYI